MPENGDKQRPNGEAIVRFPWSRGWWQVLLARRDEVTKFRLSIVAGSKSPVVPDTHSPCNDDMPSEIHVGSSAAGLAYGWTDSERRDCYLSLWRSICIVDSVEP